jgi:hypothetical protein
VRPRLEPIPRKWLKASEAAEYANQRGYPEVAVEMIRANVALGLLRAYAVGTGLFYRLVVADVDEWLEQHPWNRPVTYHFDGRRWTAAIGSPE